MVVVAEPMPHNLEEEVAVAELMLHLLEVEVAVANLMPHLLKVKVAAANLMLYLLEVEVAVAIWLLLCLLMVWCYISTFYPDLFITYPLPSIPCSLPFPSLLLLLFSVPPFPPI